MKNAEWYVDWFNSPYYHLLYNNRNFSEANFFIDNLCSNLKLQPESTIWDLACGKGRHAIALNSKKLRVIGTDLSVNSISEASKAGNANLEFFVHDMRQPFKVDYFDAVFNLFTSIGYFKEQADNFLVFENVALSLKKGSVFVVDFFNAKKVMNSFHSDYREERGNIIFEIKKSIVNNAIVKHIDFSDGNKNYFFEEYVSLLTQNDFEEFGNKAGLSLLCTYGNYQFDAFDEKTSDRLILVFKK